jgi:hypothetical protein
MTRDPFEAAIEVAFWLAWISAVALIYAGLVRTGVVA